MTLREKRGYWKVKQETLGGSLWRIRLEGGYEADIRQTRE